MVEKKTQDKNLHAHRDRRVGAKAVVLMLENALLDTVGAQFQPKPSRTSRVAHLSDLL